ncbi:Uncharacterised protein [Mycobacteroides abscessus subsp. massiliense]|nr:Uncharacterised protein [Mycobacteroides abscessus subsp. massiliense]
MAAARPGDDDPRLVAQVFSTRLVRLLASQHHPWPSQRLAPLIALVDGKGSLGEAFEAAYGVLQREYRCEYVYKNEIITRAPADAHTMTGLRVFLSIADVAVAGGHGAAAYEIKTDLDSFARLELQLLSYSRCFEQVNVVTSPAKAMRAVETTPVHIGVLTLDGEHALTVVREPAGGLGRLELAALFPILRKDELHTILQAHCGYTAPERPRADEYHTRYELFMALPLETAYPAFVAALQRRDQRSREAACAADLPASLHGVAAGLVLSNVGWKRLGDLMAQPASQFAPGANSRVF